MILLYFLNLRINNKISFYFNRLETTKSLNYHQKLTDYIHKSQILSLTSLILAAQLDALTTGLAIGETL